MVIWCIVYTFVVMLLIRDAHMKAVNKMVKKYGVIDMKTDDVVGVLSITGIRKYDDDNYPGHYSIEVDIKFVGQMALSWKVLGDRVSYKYFSTRRLNDRIRSRVRKYVSEHLRYYNVEGMNHYNVNIKRIVWE